MTGLNSIAVCDGMGGHAGGSTASSLAAQRCTTIEDDAVDDLRASTAQRVQATSNFLNDVSDSTPDLYGLGTTLVTVLIDAYGSVLVANVGDSRAYRLESGFLGQLTIDHRSEESNRLTQALGGGRRTALEPAFFDCHLDDGGILLCSDGVCDFVSEDALETEMSRTDTSRPLSERVVELALAGGGGDNATAVYVRRPDPLTGPRH
ncbi:PP2C family protein-serine/threonine phosphatase [Gordonia alkanivorans]|uniref:PP2C family protein-serine/threonine phosphatase n=1 Tax=Gordonia alkanivorans TaxID=84096 RepID=UPI001F4DAFF4|nr:protein phosphatase 2C domain-containing protein [Gordonia alkanivorans]